MEKQREAEHAGGVEAFAPRPHPYEILGALIDVMDEPSENITATQYKAGLKALGYRVVKTVPAGTAFDAPDGEDWFRNAVFVEDELPI